LIGWSDCVELSAPTGSANGAAAMPKISNTNKILRTVFLSWFYAHAPKRQATL
jgi:hypothetical protein